MRHAEDILPALILLLSMALLAAIGAALALLSQGGGITPQIPAVS